MVSVCFNSVNTIFNKNGLMMIVGEMIEGQSSSPLTTGMTPTTPPQLPTLPMPIMDHLPPEIGFQQQQQRRRSSSSTTSASRRNSFARRRSVSISEHELETQLGHISTEEQQRLEGSVIVSSHFAEEKEDTVQVVEPCLPKQLPSLLVQPLRKASICEEEEEEAERDYLETSHQEQQQIQRPLVVEEEEEDDDDDDDDLRRDSQISTATEDILFKGYTHSVISISCQKNPKVFGSNEFGLKIVGGKEIPNSGGILGAYISKLHPAFAEAHNNQIQLGDVVLECNGISLENKTFEEVQSQLETIVEDQMNLIIRSNFNIHTGKARIGCLTNDSSNESNPTNLEDNYDSSGGGQSLRQDNSSTTTKRTNTRIRQQRASSSSTTSAAQHHHQQQLIVFNSMQSSNSGEIIEMRRSPSSSTVTTNEDQQLPPRQPVILQQQQQQQQSMSITIQQQMQMIGTPPTEPLSQHLQHQQQQQQQPNNRRKRLQRKRSTSRRGGQLQLQICHDPTAAILYVTVIRAKLQQHSGENPFPKGLDPYIVVSIIPPKTITNQRRTRHIPNTSTPVWNQTMVYPNVSTNDLLEKKLEISVWHFTAEQQNDICLGTLNLQLAEEGILDERPHLYRLTKPTNNNNNGNSSSGAVATAGVGTMAGGGGPGAGVGDGGTSKNGTSGGRSSSTPTANTTSTTMGIFRKKKPVISNRSSGLSSE